MPVIYILKQSSPQDSKMCHTESFVVNSFLAGRKTLLLIKNQCVLLYTKSVDSVFWVLLWATQIWDSIYYSPPGKVEPHSMACATA